MKKQAFLFIILVYLILPIHLFSAIVSNESKGIIKSHYSNVHIMIYTPNLNNVNSLINGLGFENV